MKASGSAGLPLLIALGFIVVIRLDGYLAVLVIDVLRLPSRIVLFPLVVRRLEFRDILQVPGLGHIEIDPHLAVVRERREDVPFIDEAALLIALAIYNPIKGRRYPRKSQFGRR